METLRSGVRDLGIGLTAFGGNSSMGPGGYAGTPLDATLPVTAQIPQQLKRPPVAVVLVLETMESPTADQVMRGAAKAVVDQLSAYKAFGLTHVMLDFRRDSLGEMLEILELVAKEIRPAVDRV